MVKFYERIEPHLAEWAMAHAVFFVASAPLRGRHVNLSAKGLPSSSLSILNPNQCAYVDATGSGIETVSHLQENGRCTVMGRVVGWNEPSFDSWLKKKSGKTVVGARDVIVLDVFKVQTSCGFAVPYLAVKADPGNKSKSLPYLEDLATLGHWAGKQISAGVMDNYRSEWNVRSLDGLPGLRVARRDAGQRLWFGDLRAHLQKRNVPQLALVAIVSAFVTILCMHLFGLTSFDIPLPLQLHVIT